MPCECAPQEFEAAVYESMKDITAYCGEDLDSNDPSRILRVVRDFVKLFEKALGDIKVRQLRGVHTPPSWSQFSAIPSSQIAGRNGQVPH